MLHRQNRVHGVILRMRCAPPDRLCLGHQPLHWWLAAREITRRRQCFSPRIETAVGGIAHASQCGELRIVL